MHGKMYAYVVRSLTGGGQDHNKAANLASSLFEEAHIFSREFLSDRRFLYSVKLSFSFSRFPVHEDNFLCKAQSGKDYV